MLDLAYRARRHDFALARLPVDRSLQVQDVSFNALLVIANRDLTAIARDAGVPIEPALRERFDAAPEALETLWSEEHGTYCARHAVTGRTLGPPTIAAFTMLAAGTHTERLAGLVDRLRNDAWWPAHPVPSIATDAPEFDPRRYWAGPTWVNTNWIVIEGLRHRGETALADEIRRRTVALVARYGCAEYFSPRTGAPLGANGFSWTAALTLDLAEPAAV
jgi:glycogen debranching enzyme